MFLANVGFNNFNPPIDFNIFGAIGAVPFPSRTKEAITPNVSLAIVDIGKSLCRTSTGGTVGANPILSLKTPIA